MAIASSSLKADRVFHALGEPSRRAIVERLSNGPTTVSSMAIPLGITIAAVMQHLQVLEKSGLVKSEKTGRVRTCSLQTQGLDVMEAWIRDQRSNWERKLDRLGELLSESED